MAQSMPSVCIWCLVKNEEELLPAIEGRVGELVSMSIEILCMYRASLSMCTEEFQTGSVPVNHDKGGNLVVVVGVGGDLEDVMDGGFLKIYMPPGTWVDAWLGACWQGGLGFLFLFPRNLHNLCVHIALHQCIDDICKGGGHIQGIEL